MKNSNKTLQLLLTQIIYLALIIITKLHGQTITIKSSASSISLGGSLEISVTVNTNINNVTVWPFINNKQWGADQPVFYDSTSKTSTTTLLLPFVNTGTQNVVVALLGKNPFGGQPFTIGQPLPSNAESKSNTLSINVNSLPRAQQQLNALHNPSNPSNPLMFYESWFTPNHHNFKDTAEAIPLIGRYSSTMTDPMKMHALWFNNVGIKGIVTDWTNNLYGKTNWNQRDSVAQQMINATTDLFVYWSSVRRNKILNTTPTIVLLLGMCNGSKNTTITALEQEIDWITSNYYNKYPELFFIHPVENKPLLLIWDGCNMHFKVGVPNNTKQYSVHYMTAHLNSGNGANMGYFSWMDGSLTPRPTYYNNGTNTGPVEALTITTAYFGSSGGWLSPTEAMATNNGASLLEEGISAAKYSPSLLFVNQWNEFAGNSERSGDYSYLDIYNSTLGNDIEPTSLTTCAYPRPNNAYCGGWGFRQLNVLKAIIYNVNVNVNSFFMAIFSPVPWTTYAKSYYNSRGGIKVEWIVLGTCPSASYTVSVDGSRVTSTSSLNYKLAISSLSNGKHTLLITATNCKTQLVLSETQLSPIQSGGVTASDTVVFVVQS